MSTQDADIRRHRLTVEEYYRMAELGILAPDARVELIEGEIIDMAPQGSRHASIVSRLYERLVAVVGQSGIVRCQLPIRLGTRSEPEPDFAIVKRNEQHYMNAHPVAADVLLLIEFADTTASYDRLIKMPLYARHGILEAWLIDLQATRVHVFRDPQNGTYADVFAIDRPEALCPGSMPSVSIDLTGIF